MGPPVQKQATALTLKANKWDPPLPGVCYRHAATGSLLDPCVGHIPTISVCWAVYWDTPHVLNFKMAVQLWTL